jgi:hypothetical protein
MYVTAQGEQIARKTPNLNVQDRTGAKTLRGSSHPRLDSPPRADEAKRESIDTLRRQSAFPSGSGRPKRVRGDREQSRLKTLASKPWKGKNPREQPATRCAKHTPDRKGLSKGSKPRSRGSPGRVVRFGDGGTGVRNGRWVLPGGNAADTFREGNASKGESQERRRGETDPTRARKE